MFQAIVSTITIAVGASYFIFAAVKASNNDSSSGENSESNSGSGGSDRNSSAASSAPSVSRSGSSSQRPAHSRNAQEMPHIELGQLRTQNPPVARTSDQNIRALKEQEQKLISKRSEIQAKIKEKSALARSGHAQNNMQQVKVALIQKKQYEKQLVLYNNFLGDIEELRAELENVSQDQELQNFIEEQRAMSVAVSNVLDRPTGDDLTEEEENELTVELEELLRE